MDIYLIRHAHALELGERGVTEDADRPLSERGEGQAETVARGLAKKDIRLELLVSSPLVRARQTAEIMQRTWSPAPPEIQFTDTLVPDSKPRKLARFLRRLSAERIGLVGHEPHLSMFGAWLIGSRKAKLALAKAGVARITCDEAPGKGAGMLQWMVPPEWLEG